ncbi:hypothetical protein MBHK15_60036 [Marinobacter salarius]|nr:hypothetical protein MBHK15_60036 [Marinobacter salarius]
MVALVATLPYLARCAAIKTALKSRTDSGPSLTALASFRNASRTFAARARLLGVDSCGRK